uniref:RNA-directed RNA polymerase catalytic subunit n=1 Tax=Wuhan Mosquito Virus 4 TaxID=1608129 RepID=A0A5Q0TW21_9ORTO|nr:RNA-dependent RNA polymerase [Wuhan Mosquito Virus 4]
MPFEERTNSFFNTVFMLGKRSDIDSPPSSALNGLNSISALYQYTNPPPMGYGTPAPKVVETVLRAYGMNKNEEEKKFISIDGYRISNTVWVSDDKEFPWYEPASNFSAPDFHRAARAFLFKNQKLITKVVENEMTIMVTQNSDILTRGKQTYCPLIESSMPCPRAYKNMLAFFTKNGSPPNLTLIQLISEFFRILGMREVVGKRVENQLKQYTRNTLKGTRKAWKLRKVIKRHTYKGDDAFHYVLGLARSFCTYLKHSERAHLQRRAIASPNIVKRAFLHIIEKVHLALGEELEGSTISIGGERKKDKIVSTMNKLATNDAVFLKKQATEDATKWNETLSASLFGMMHETFFDPGVREELDLSPPTTLETLFGRICRAAHFILSLKRVTLGPGLQGRSDLFHGHIPFTREGLNQVNSANKAWFSEMLPFREGNCYLQASPGMLMGMMNAASTTVGLVSVNYYHQTESTMKTLRSSDDSMTIHAGSSMEDLRRNIDLQYCELKISAVSLSPKKTLVFANRYGEYTSWFQDGKLVSQFGPETTTLRPAGQNPHDDAYLAAKGTSISLLNCSSNPIGSEVKLALGIYNVRALYRIQPCPENDHLGPKVRVISDGGYNPWDVGNCHLEETSLKKHFAPESTHGYYLRIRNPENPFISQAEESTYYDRETGTLQVGMLDNPKTVFSFIKRGNRASVQRAAGSNAESEVAAQQALDVITSLDYSTTLITPKEATPSGVFCLAGFNLLREGITLSEEEEELVNAALAILKGEEEEQDGLMDADFFDECDYLQ